MYIDDVTAYGVILRNWKNLEFVFERLREVNLRVNLEKTCYMKRLSFLDT